MLSICPPKHIQQTAMCTSYTICRQLYGYLIYIQQMPNSLYGYLIHAQQMLNSLCDTSCTFCRCTYDYLIHLQSMRRNITENTYE